MIYVTDEALGFLARLLDINESPDGMLARCAVDNGRLIVQPGEEQPGDVVFRHHDRPVLAMSNRIAAALSNRTIDAANSGDGEKLTLREQPGLTPGEHRPRA